MVPLSREITKIILNKFGYWKKRTVILGSGRNAREAYYALQSHEVSGFKIDAFCDFDATADIMEECPIVKDEETLLTHYNSFSTQFVVACDFDEKINLKTGYDSLRNISAVTL